MTTTRAALYLLALRWADLANTLGTPSSHAWYGTGIRSHLAADEHADRIDAAALRALERSPEQIGARPTPIRLDVYEAMQEITADMRECADVLATRIQVAPIVAAPYGLVLPPAKAARRREEAARDAADPRRWPIGAPLPMETAAAWIAARVSGAPGPFRFLDHRDHEIVCGYLRTALWRAEQALDRGVHVSLTLAQPCPQCGGQVTMRGVRAACGGCRASWTAGPVAA